MTIPRIQLVLMLAVVTNGAAQSIHGVVSEKETGTPLVGAFVVLLDSASNVRGGTLTDHAGRFFLRAPYAGRFSLRAEMIGHETLRTNPFLASETEPTIAKLAMPVSAVKLEALEVTGARRCARRSDLALETARVWAEARKALTVVLWTENQIIAQYVARNFERVLDPRTFLIQRQTVTTVASTNRPYAAISPDTLAKYGFMRRTESDSIAFYGPDAEVLLSDAFLDTHCFSLRRNDKEALNLIGLAFEPVPGRKVQDIKGTLWLDPRTSELKFIDFRYTELPSDIDARGVGGRTDFRRLPNGAWIVDRWYIRLPMMQRGFRALTVLALVEGGGEIVNARLVDSKIEALSKMDVSGLVYDSVQHVPLGNAIVYLSGTSHRTVTDSVGRFTLNDVMEGHYVAAFWHASFDSLPSLPEPQAIHVAAFAPADVRLSIPSLKTLLERTCESDGGGVLTGYVRDVDGLLLTTEMVKSSYKLKDKVVEVEGESDRSGRFVLCGLPLNTDLTVTTPGGATAKARVGPARFARKDIQEHAPSARPRD